MVLTMVSKKYAVGSRVYYKYAEKIYWGTVAPYDLAEQTENKYSLPSEARKVWCYWDEYNGEQSMKQKERITFMDEDKTFSLYNRNLPGWW